MVRGGPHRNVLGQLFFLMALSDMPPGDNPCLLRSQYESLVYNTGPQLYSICVVGVALNLQMGRG